MWFSRALLLAMLALPGAALAQPSQKPIRIIVPFAPGASADGIARAIANDLGARTGRPVVVENRVGAGGTLGVGAVAKADPDGHTILVHSTTHVVAPATYSNPGYDVARDLAGVTSLVSLPNVLVVAPNKYKTLKDLVDTAKAKPGAMNYASAGVGSAAHLNGERFRLATGIDVQHVPYKGGPEGLTAVMTGDCEFYFIPLPAARGLVSAGKLAVLAVSGSSRASALPEVPTTVEAGFPNSEYNFWVGMFAPATTPKATVDKLNAETLKALSDPAVKEKLAKLGGDPLPMQPAAFDAFIRKEIEINAMLVKAAKIQMN